MEGAVQFHVESSSVGSIGKLVFDCPAENINTLSMAVLKELEAIVDTLVSTRDVKALIIASQKPSVFVAGANLKEIPLALKNPSQLDELIHAGHRTFSKIEALPFPTIAVVNGACLGGGLELALACHYRIASDSQKTVFALPETSLGIFPAWGGSQRLPRLIGLAAGLEMILSGKKVDAKKALKMHLIDALAPAPYLEEYAQEFLFSIFNKSERKKILSRRTKRSLYNILTEENFIGRKLLFQGARKALLAKTKGHYLAPELALNLIEETYALPLAEGLNKEIETALKNANLGFSQAVNLIDLYATHESLKKDPQGIPKEIQPAQIQEAGVIGAGTMGSAIAWLLTNHNYDTRLKDLNWQLLGKGNGKVYALFKKAWLRKKLSSDQLSFKFHHLSCSTDYSGFNRLDIVLEAAVENLKVKQELFKEIENAVNEKTLIATNTSSLTISELAGNLSHPERFLGIHFFNPVEKMPLVEIIAGQKTSLSAVATAIDFCKKMGKTPLVVGDCPGFLVNRILIRGLNEILWMLQEGVPMHQIEETLEAFGMPMSPFELSDEIGNDVSYKVTKMLEKAYGNRMKCPEILQMINDQELFGKKNAKGFFLYSGKEPSVNPDIALIVSAYSSKPQNLDDKTILERFIFSMADEAARCLEEKIVASPAYLDLALILGAGFPPFHGGLMKYIDSIGKGYVFERLKTFENLYGARFAPADSLRL